ALRHGMAPVAAHVEHAPVLDVHLDAADGVTEAAEAPVGLDHRVPPSGLRPGRRERQATVRGSGAQSLPGQRGGGGAAYSSSSVRMSFRTSVGSKKPTLYTFRTRCCVSSRKTFRTWRKSPVQ